MGVGLHMMPKVSQNYNKCNAIKKQRPASCFNVCLSLSVLIVSIVTLVVLIANKLLQKKDVMDSVDN